MRSNYKRLGDYIQPVEGRNKILKDIPLMGLSINKVFIPSIANIIGTDMSTYRLIRRYQFAYGPVTSRNGEKITIALFDQHDEALISQAYFPFEVIDAKKLLPEYLMMWFKRPEFDRYARFMSHGSAREIFSWEDMCNTRLPIPHPDKQREIVAEYHTIQKRIELNKQLIKKLEDTAQAVHRQWFVEFEFPDADGKPYKSNGGTMVWCEELGKEIPKGWKHSRIKNICNEMKSGGTPSREKLEYWNRRDIPWLKTGEINNRIITCSEEFISYAGLLNSSAKVLPINSVLIAMYGEGKTKGQAGYLRIAAATNQACCAMVCNNEQISTYLYYFLRANQSKIAGLANGGAQPNLSKELIENIELLEPEQSILRKHPLLAFVNYSESLEREVQNLRKLKDLLLSKLAAADDVVNVEQMANFEY